METSEHLPKPKTKTKPAPAKTKTSKKRKSDGPTCSMFLSEMTRKLMSKKKSEEASKNIVQTVIDSISSALPIRLSKRSLKTESPVLIETLQTYAPELLSKDQLSIPVAAAVALTEDELDLIDITEEEILPSRNQNLKMPKMPITSSDVLKKATERRAVYMEDVAVNTGSSNDVASELVKHVGTLKKISLIAEEFNQKTAKNLKEIVDSVQEDLLKKLEELKAEQQTVASRTAEMPKIQEQNI